MATIKKAPGGALIKKVLKSIGEGASKTITKGGKSLGTDAYPKKTLAKKVKDVKLQNHLNKHGMEDVTSKDFNKMVKSHAKGTTDINKTPNSPRPMLTDAQKANNAKILQEIKDGKRKNGGKIGKMRNGGSLSGLTASNKRVGPVDPKGAFTKVQKKTLAGAKGKASLTKDKQLGATKMTKK